MSHRRVVRKPKQTVNFDHGTEERAAQQGGLIYEKREGDNGARLGARAKAECAIDALLLIGALGEGDAAVTRHKAGEWLRELYLATHPTRTAMSWEMRGRDQSEMSDRMAWNLKCLSDTYKALGPYRAIVQAICCDDRATADVQALQAGLDLLAKLRGLDNGIKRVY